MFSTALVTAYPYGANLSGDPVVFIVSLINLVAFLYVLMLMLRGAMGQKVAISNRLETLNQHFRRRKATKNAVNQARFVDYCCALHSFLCGSHMEPWFGTSTSHKLASNRKTVASTLT